MRSSKQTIDIAVLKEQVCEVRGDITTILNNHLPHIQAALEENQKSISNINVKLATWSGAIVVAIWLLEHFS